MFVKQPLAKPPNILLLLLLLFGEQQYTTVDFVVKPVGRAPSLMVP